MSETVVRGRPPSVRGAFALVAALGVFALGDAAQAQGETAAESGSGLEEVVVSTRRRVEVLQDVPISVQAFTAERIEAQGIRNVQDIANLTPGLSFDKGFAPQDTRPNIRGLPTTRGRPPIGILLDGIDISSESIATAGGSNLMNLKLVDVERIEVVKGPQSALYGRVAFGGAINYVSKKPSTEGFEGSVNLDVATDGLYEVRGAVNIPLGDTLALRVNGLYSKFDGFYRNTVTGNDIGGWETKGIAGALRFNPSDDVDFTLRLAYSDDDGEVRPSYYFGQRFADRRSVLPLPANAVGLVLGAPGMGTTMPASIPYPLLGEVRAGEPVALSVDPLTGREFEGGDLNSFVSSLVGDIDLGWATLSSWTGYMTGDTLSRADADFFGAVPGTVTLPTAGTAEPLNAFQITDLDTDVKQFSQELRLGNLDGERFRWAVGALYWKEDYESINASIFVGGFFRSPPLAPAGWSVARELQLRGALPGDLNRRDTEHLSGYVIGEYSFNDQWELAVEGRYSKEDFSYVFGRALSLPITPTGTILPATFAGTVFRPQSDTTFFAPKVTLNYEPTDDTLFYATASKGVKPAGFLNVGVVLDVNDAKYKPEVLWNYELGFKTSWLDNRLRVNGAVFHMIYEDRINQLLVPDLRSPQGTSTLVVNQGEAKVDGLELEINARVSDLFTFSLAYTYLDPRLTESEVPTVAALAVGGSGNCRVGQVGPQTVCFVNDNGRQMEQSARNAVTATLDFRTTLANGWDLTSSLIAQGRSRRFLSAQNLQWLPGYSQFDWNLGVSTEKFSALLYVNNLFDDDTVRSSQTYGDPFIASPVAPPVLAYTIYPADPRQVGLRLGYKF